MTLPKSVTTNKNKNKDNFKTIFIGHTPTIYWTAKEDITTGGIIRPKGQPITMPIKAANIWNVDTGCGKGNFPLTIMNPDTEEFWQITKEELK